MPSKKRYEGQKLTWHYIYKSTNKIRLKQKTKIAIIPKLLRVKIISSRAVNFTPAGRPAAGRRGLPRKARRQEGGRQCRWVAPGQRVCQAVAERKPGTLAGRASGSARRRDSYEACGRFTGSGRMLA